jgi:hypothetical protein
MRRVASLLLVATSLGACATKDSAVDSAKTSQAAKADGPRVVTVNAKDFAYMASDTIQSGMTTFRLINDGTVLHHLLIARLDSGKTMTDLVAALKKPGLPPRWMVMLGGPNAPDPKAESNATLDVAPGNYALVCFVDLPGGVPHFAKGMIKGLTVVPATGAMAAAPIADDSVALSDYAFTLSKPLSTGHHTFRVVNTSAQPHELELIKLAPGKSVKDLLAWLKSPNGPPPGNGLGGTTPAAAGMPIYFSADLTAGNYLLICFLPDAKDGKMHVEHGMSLTQMVQ